MVILFWKIYPLLDYDDMPSQRHPFSLILQDSLYLNNDSLNSTFLLPNGNDKGNRDHFWKQRSRSSSLHSSEDPGKKDYLSESRNQSRADGIAECNEVLSHYDYSQRQVETNRTVDSFPAFNLGSLPTFGLPWFDSQPASSHSELNLQHFAESLGQIMKENTKKEREIRHQFQREKEEIEEAHRIKVRTMSAQVASLQSKKDDIHRQLMNQVVQRPETRGGISLDVLRKEKEDLEHCLHARAEELNARTLATQTQLGKMKAEFTVILLANAALKQQVETAHNGPSSRATEQATQDEVARLSQDVASRKRELEAARMEAADLRFAINVCKAEKDADERKGVELKERLDHICREFEKKAVWEEKCHAITSEMESIRYKMACEVSLVEQQYKSDTERWNARAQSCETERKALEAMLDSARTQSAKIQSELSEAQRETEKRNARERGSGAMVEVALIDIERRIREKEEVLRVERAGALAYRIAAEEMISRMHHQLGIASPSPDITRELLPRPLSLQRGTVQEPNGYTSEASCKDRGNGYTSAVSCNERTNGYVSEISTKMRGGMAEHFAQGGFGASEPFRRATGYGSDSSNRPTPGGRVPSTGLHRDTHVELGKGYTSESSSKGNVLLEKPYASAALRPDNTSLPLNTMFSSRQAPATPESSTQSTANFERVISLLSGSIKELTRASRHSRRRSKTEGRAPHSVQAARASSSLPRRAGREEAKPRDSLSGRCTPVPASTPYEPKQQQPHEVTMRGRRGSESTRRSLSGHPANPTTREGKASPTHHPHRNFVELRSKDRPRPEAWR